MGVRVGVFVRGGFPGGLPGGFPGGFPGGLPGGFPGGGVVEQSQSDSEKQEGFRHRPKSHVRPASHSPGLAHELLQLAGGGFWGGGFPPTLQLESSWQLALHTLSIPSLFPSHN